MPSDSDDDDRPRRRRPRSRRRNHGPGAGVWLSLAVLVLLIVIGGVVAVRVSRSDGQGGVEGTPGADHTVRAVTPGKASPPSSWKEYTHADAGFRAYFPGAPQRVQDESLGMVGEVAGKALMIEYTAHGFEDETALTAWVFTRRLPPHIPPDQYRELLNREFENTARFPIVNLRLVEARPVTWMGHKVQEFRLTPDSGRRDRNMIQVQRCVVTDTLEIHAEIAAQDGRKLTAHLIDGFFDNIRPLQ